VMMTRRGGGRPQGTGPRSRKNRKKRRQENEGKSGGAGGPVDRLRDGLERASEISGVPFSLVPCQSPNQHRKSSRSARPRAFAIAGIHPGMPTYCASGWIVQGRLPKLPARRVASIAVCRRDRSGARRRQSMRRSATTGPVARRYRVRISRRPSDAPPPR